MLGVLLVLALCLIPGLLLIAGSVPLMRWVVARRPEPERTRLLDYFRRGNAVRRRWVVAGLALCVIFPILPLTISKIGVSGPVWVEDALIALIFVSLVAGATIISVCAVRVWRASIARGL